MNLIGEHTDYNDGLALPFAIAQGVTVAATPIAGLEVHAIALDLGEEDRFDPADPAPAAGWRAFVRGMVASLDVPSGMRLEISADLPRGAGLSSSAALSVALGLALVGEVDRAWLASICSRVENEWVGARTGLLDQTASLRGRAGHALRIDFRDLSVEPVPLELGEWRLVTVDSGEAHAHDASGYNERRAECAEACELLGVESLRELAPATLDRPWPRPLRVLPEPLDRRVRHVLHENERVEATVAALRVGDLAEVGRLLDASHASLRDLYDSSTPAVERTVAALREAGAAGARMMGGGFGGHVLALLPAAMELPAGAREVTPRDGAQLR